MSQQAAYKDSISIALVGKGGAGVLTAGEILLTAAARCGRYGLLIPAVGPQIRGGESAGDLPAVPSAHAAQSGLATEIPVHR